MRWKYKFFTGMNFETNLLLVLSEKGASGRKMLSHGLAVVGQRRRWQAGRHELRGRPLVVCCDQRLEPHISSDVSIPKIITTAVRFVLFVSQSRIICYRVRARRSECDWRRLPQPLALL
jgi:hypothetical protein